MKKWMKPAYVMAAVTMIYGFVTLVTLGSTKAPQTYYTATAEDYMFTV